MKKPAALLLLLLPLLCSAQEDSLNSEYYYININSVGKLDRKPEMAIDSVKLNQVQSGDTIVQNIVYNYFAAKKREIKKLQKNLAPGEELQIGMKLKDGKTMAYEIKPYIFLAKGDSLFLYSRIYTISEDSVKKLWRRQESPATDSKGKERIDKIIEANTRYGYSLIFSPTFFENGNIEQKIVSREEPCGKTVTLKNFWEFNNVRYYQIVVTNRCGKLRRSQEIVLTDKMEFVKFGEFFNHRADVLTEQNNRSNVFTE